MKHGMERIGRTVTVAQARRSCLEKRKFASKNEARDRAARYLTLEPEWKPMRPYRCALCHGWHLTTQQVKKEKGPPT